MVESGVGELPEAAKESSCEDIMAFSLYQGVAAGRLIGSEVRRFLPLHWPYPPTGDGTVAFCSLGCRTAEITVTLDTCQAYHKRSRVLLGLSRSKQTYAIAMVEARAVFLVGSYHTRDEREDASETVLVVARQNLNEI